MTTTLTSVTLPTLRATPSAVRALVEGVPEEVRQAAPPPEAKAGDWSISTVVAHLIDGHRRQVGRIRLMLEQDQPRPPKRRRMGVDGGVGPARTTDR